MKLQKETLQKIYDFTLQAVREDYNAHFIKYGRPQDDVTIDLEAIARAAGLVHMTEVLKGNQQKMSTYLNLNRNTVREYCKEFGINTAAYKQDCAMGDAYRIRPILPHNRSR